MSTELIQKQSDGIDFTVAKNRNSEVDETLRVCNILLASKVFTDTNDLAKAYVKVECGKEWGYGPVASMRGVHLMPGKPPMYGVHLISGKLVREGYDYLVLEDTKERCRIRFIGKKGEVRGELTYTMQDAITQGLASKDNYKKVPANMLYARCMSTGAVRYCAGAFGGSTPYTPEDFGYSVDEKTNQPVSFIEPNGNSPQSEVIFTPGAKPQSEATSALQAKLDAKKAAMKKEVTPAQVAELIPPGPGDAGEPDLFNDFDVVPGDRD